MIYKSNIKISNLDTRPPSLLRVLAKGDTVIKPIFAHRTFIFRIIWWRHINMNLNIHAVYIPCIYFCFLYTFLSLLFQLPKEISVSLNNTKEYKIHKVVLIKFKVWKVNKQLLNQSLNFKKDVKKFSIYQSLSYSVLGVVCRHFF